MQIDSILKGGKLLNFKIITFDLTKAGYIILKKIIVFITIFDFYMLKKILN